MPGESSRFTNSFTVQSDITSNFGYLFSNILSCKQSNKYGRKIFKPLNQILFVFQFASLILLPSFVHKTAHTGIDRYVNAFKQYLAFFYFRYIGASSNWKVLLEGMPVGLSASTMTWFLWLRYSYLPTPKNKYLKPIRCNF